MQTRQFPLSFGQKRLWFLEQLHPGSGAYNISGAVQLRGKLNEQHVREALLQLVMRHEALRTSFPRGEVEAVQSIVAEGTIDLQISEVSEPGGEAQERQIQAIACEEAAQGFDLQRAPLMRVRLIRCGPERNVLVLTMHHIVSDGWSIGILLSEFCTLYRALEEHREECLAELPLQYADYSQWQQQRLQGTRLERDREFWRRELQEARELELPLDRPRPAQGSFRGCTHHFEIASELLERLRDLSRQHRATLFASLLTAFNALLYRYTGQTDILIGTPVSGRQRSETHGIVGLLLNTIPLRNRVAPRESFAAALEAIRHRTALALSHSELPLEQLIASLELPRSVDRNPLFQVTFALQPDPLGRIAIPGLGIAPVRLTRVPVRFDLEVDFFEDADRLRGAVLFSEDLFDGASIARLVRHYQRVLEQAVRDPERPIAEFQLLSDTERHQLIVECNRTAAAYPEHSCVHELFVAQVARTPEALAVIRGKDMLSFAELERHANQLAWHLHSLGVKPETAVGLCLESSPDLLIGLLGILKVGGAYVPLDPDYPRERLTYMLADADAVAVVTDTTLEERVSRQGLETVRLDALRGALANYPDSAPGVPVDPDGLAYIMYTSGSTGKPKGVMVPHRGVVNYLSYIRSAYRTDRGQGAPVNTSIGFDATVTSLLGPLVGGTPVRFLSAGHPIEALHGLMSVIPELTLVKLTPSHLEGLSAFSPDASLGEPRALIIGGEMLRAATLRTWRKRLPRTRLINEYGPTEAVVGCATYEVGADLDLHGAIPIGVPISNARLFVLDDHQEPVPVGVAGELYVGGAGLARGYRSRGGLTAERFVPSPFGHGERLYRTGDRARFLADGNLDYLGRLDQQVKVRGHRIELGEIEAALLAQPGIRQAVVVTREKERGALEIVACVVPGSAAPPNVRDLRAGLSCTLPGYMIPEHIFVLEELPLSAHGKLDRNALPLSTCIPEEAAYVPPATSTEQKLARIWAEVLHHERLSVHDNFFAFGGDSIRALEVCGRAQQENLTVSPRLLLKHQTVATLAQAIDVACTPVEAPSLEQAPFPLTPIQTTWLGDSAPTERYSQWILLSGAQTIDLERLQMALNGLVTHHAALRLRLERSAAGWMQRYIAAGKVPIVIHEVSRSQTVPRVDGWEPALAGQHASFALLENSQSPLIRAVLLREAGHPDRLILIAHHFAVDGVSWRILLEDLNTLYEARDGRIQLTVSTSWAQWAAQLEQAVRARVFQEERLRWLGILQHAVAPLPVRSGFALGANTYGGCATRALGLGQQASAQLVAQAARHAPLSVQYLLVAAVFLSVSEWTGANSLRLDVESHGRDHPFDELDVTRTVGWFTAIYPVLLVKESRQDPLETLRRVRSAFRELKHSGLAFGVLQSFASVAGPERTTWSRRSQILFNYLGHFGKASGTFQLAREGGSLSADPIRLRDYLIEAVAAFHQGQLQISLSYCPQAHAESEIDALSDRILQWTRHLTRALQDRAPHELRDEESVLSPANLIEPDLHTRNEAFPLTDVQEAYFIGRSRQLALGGVSCHIYFEAELADLDAARLETAWNILIERHDMLRAVVSDNARQRVLAEVPRYRIPVNEWVSEKLSQASIQQLRARMSHQVRPYDRWPSFELQLSRLPGGRTRLHISLDLMFCDAWSIRLLLSELSALYYSPGSPLLPLRITYRDYLQAKLSSRQSRSYARALRYWRERLATLPGGPQLPLARDPRTVRAPRFVRRRGRLDPNGWAQLCALSRGRGLTASALLLTVFGAVIARASRVGSFCMNLTLFDRPPWHPDINGIVGDFTSVVLVEVHWRSQDSLSDFANAIQSQLWTDLEHSEVSGVQVVREIMRSGLRVERRYPVVFTSALHTSAAVSGHTLIEHDDIAFDIAQTPQVWLDHQVIEDRGALLYMWDAVEALFPQGFLDRLLSEYEGLLHLLLLNHRGWSLPMSELFASIRGKESSHAGA